MTIGSTIMQQTLGSYPGETFPQAMARAIADSNWLAGIEHVQLCPQNRGVLDDQTLAELKRMAPNTHFRLHANVHVPGSALRNFEAINDSAEAKRYYKCIAAVNLALGNPHYSLHAGRRAGGTLKDLWGRLRNLSDLMGTRVGVEGLYPTHGSMFLIDSWEEYAQLLRSGVDFAIDLSHLNIVARRSRRIELTLTRELLASSHLIEVHVSGNNGYADSHVPLRLCGTQWWEKALAAINPDAVVFYEGNEVRTPEQTRRVMGFAPEFEAPIT